MRRSRELRAKSARVRFTAAEERDEAGRARDEASEGRDLVARARDRLAAGIRANLDPHDLVVRFGDNEFVCALADTDLGDAHACFEAIQDAFERSRRGVSISFGLAEYQAGDTLDDLILRGEAARYEARQRRPG